MRPRDRMVLAAVIAVVVIAGGWMKVVSPERAKVSGAQSKVESATQQLQSAEGELSQARSAQAKYTEAYASIVRLGKAVPAQQEVPALVYELEHAANSHHVEFASISSSGSGSTAGSASAAAAAPAGFTQLPFTFTFNGSFADLYHLLSTLQGLASYQQGGGLDVSGRLLTIQNLNLVPAAASATSETGSGAGGKGGSGKGHSAKPSAPGEHLTGTITATAYVLPPSVGLTGGATPSGPSGSAAVPASSGSGSSTAPAAPATIKAVP